MRNGIAMGTSYLGLWMAITLVGAGGVRAREVVAVVFKIPPKVTVGEPVIVEFAVKNGLNETIRMNLGAYHKWGFRFVLAQPDGTKRELPNPQQGGLSEPDVFDLKVNETFSKSLVFNQWYEFDRPGRYQIEVCLREPIRNLAGANVGGSESNVSIIEVLPRNVEVLRKICDELEKDIRRSNYRDAQHSIDASFALASVRDPICIPVIMRLLKDKCGDHNVLIFGLSRIGTSEAVEAIIEDAQTCDPHYLWYSKWILEWMSPNIKDPAQREKIRKILGK